MTKHKRNAILMCSIMFFTYLVNPGNLFAFDTTITISFDREIGPVNKHIFGSALEGYDHALIGKTETGKTDARPDPARSNHGEGIWDPVWKKPVKAVVDLAKNAGLSSIRFTTTNSHKWKKTIGKERTEFLFGVDEFMKAVEEIGAEPIFTIGYLLEDPQDSADLVEYLNGTPDLSHPWASKRAENGHPAPYKVKYFEIGNEVYNSSLNVSSEEYATKYLQYYEAMKSSDSSVQIGVVLDYAPWYLKVLEIIKDRVDFGIAHFYTGPPGIGVIDERLKTMQASEIFSASLAVPVVENEYEIQQMLKHLKQFSGRDIPLAITEHNGRFAQDDPVPYRLTLGTALINAELLRIFMKPENNILMANYHTFVNGYWSMIKSESNIMSRDYRTPIKYRKRPNYYVYELYKSHFGDILLQNSIEGGAYDIQGKTSAGKQMIDQLINSIKLFVKKHARSLEDKNNIISTETVLPYLSVNTSKSNDGRTVYIIVINKNMNEMANAVINIQGFEPSERADAWILNGSSVADTNEENKDTIHINHKTVRISNKPFSFSFEPHSLTAIELIKQ